MNHSIADRTKDNWFTQAKFGLFIHWGLYSLLAGEYKGRKTDRIAEWIMNDLDIPVEEYETLAEKFFPESFDADWIVRKAKSWGMKYLVFTAKHHEGFAMYRSKCSAYNVVDATPWGRDILKELQLACERHGMRLGLYYSQAQDWHDPNGFVYRKSNEGKDFQKYLDELVKPQLRELLTGYGKISLIWFDTPMDMTLSQSRELVELVKSLQPDCLISGRIGNGLGDYATMGDNFIPRLPYPGMWEVPATLNDTWGYNQYDTNWKNPEDILRLLIKIISRGGNYLLNVGPRGDGSIPEESIKILDRAGQYVSENAEAIFDTERLPMYPYEAEGIEFTGRSHRLYVHVLKPRPRVDLLNIANKVKGAYLVSTGQPLVSRYMKACEGNSIVEVDLPEELRTVSGYCVALELEEENVIFEEI
ncbi:MAG TPA: alpha-L-fucosidase [Candidatus Choladousia intestinavium]|uniref:alpha-L-fucosidase n=1 Tax=Candidatus Choladousia intestinavium TaxID=2840727 RepID=A0A9D1D9L1_9FIRM|nr:alpha-L-fucosidase [Candidatus Choladousia intestinavium]